MDTEEIGVSSSVWLADLGQRRTLTCSASFFELGVGRGEHEAKTIGSLSNPGVEAEQDEIGDGLPSRQRARQMDGVQGTNRLGGKGAARPFDDLFVERQQRPSGGYRVEAGLAVDRIRFTKLVERDRANQVLCRIRRRSNPRQ